MARSARSASVANRRRSLRDRRSVARGGRRTSDKRALQRALAALAARMERLTADRAPRVLVVDDYRDSREMIGEYLRFRGFRVVEAGTGAEALASARTAQPDAILLDVVLPDMDGFEVLAALRHSPQTEGARIVVLTARVSDEIRERAITAGASMFIPKPTDLELIALQVAHLATRRGRSQRGALSAAH